MLWLRQSIFPFEELWSRIDFHLNVSFDVVAAPGWRYQNDPLPQWELWLLRAGRCHIESGNERAMAGVGDVVFLREGQPRLTTNADHAPLDIIGFGFSARLLGVVDAMELLQPPLCFPNRSERLAGLLENVARESSERALGYGLATTGYAQLALVEALRQIRVLDSQSAQSSDLSRRVAQKFEMSQDRDIGGALSLVAARFAEPLDVGQIADALHLSHAHFSRKFKAALGVSPVEYLRSYRLQQARGLLAQSDDSVAQIANRCGFEDAAYFSRAFKAEFGSSPLEFRRYLRGLSK